MARSGKARRMLCRKLLWAAIAVAAVLALLTGSARYLAGRFKPFLRDQTVNYLENRFDGDVELASFDVSMPIRDPLRMLLEKGKGARPRVRIDGVSIRDKSRPNLPPLLMMDQLEFQLELSTLWEKPVRVDYVKLARLELTIPPKGDRPRLAALSKAAPSGSPPKGPKEVIEAPDQKPPSRPMVLIDHVDMDGMRLVILPRNPEKEPLEFEMKTLRLESAGVEVPMRYRTVMTNARPPGLIQCSGTFGPFVTAEPGESPLTGDYSFKDANLGVFKPIDGILVSTGHFEGRLNRILVDGQADVPEFRLKSAGNAVPLKTRFHAVVDGTDGDTYLEPVTAVLGRSDLECRGGIARNKDESKKTIDLDVAVRNGRIDDFLRLAIKGARPPLRGAAQMKFRMRVPPGAGKVLDRLILDGTFLLEDAGFTSPTVQEKIDDVSRRTRGKPSATDIQRVKSHFEGDFQLEQGLLDLSRLLFNVPGTEVLLNGWYDIPSEKMDFRGVVKTEARVSQMVKTRWKRILLKPVDPFFAKDGAGAVIRISITGTRSHPQFSRDNQKKTPRPRKPGKAPVVEASEGLTGTTTMKK